jgi:hypothetical protein
MACERFLEFEFPGAGDSETFCGGSVGFNFRHCILLKYVLYMSFQSQIMRYRFPPVGKVFMPLPFGLRDIIIHW